MEASAPRILAGVSTRELNKLIDGATALELPARKILLSEGLRPTFLHILTEGTAELFIRRGRREMCVSLIEKDTPFVLAAVVKDAPYLMSARTVTDARLLCISASRFRDSMRRDPGLAQATASAMSDAYRTVVRQLRSHRLSSAQMRLAHYLVGLHQRDPESSTIRLDISKRRLASLLGLKPESLSRVFASLSEHGVHVDGEHITVTDFQLLEDLAQYDYDIDRE
jgi:CRP/FNR family transcriptional activator FtrB